MTDVRIDGRRYRLNVGVVLFNADGEVFLGRRAKHRGDHAWQFPQGGVDPGEDLLAAARRELLEETGVRSAGLIACAPGWITYDFPEGFSGSKAMKGFAGQTQAWFAFRFEGPDAEVDLEAHDAVEFDAWRWAPLETTVDEVVPFKRKAYAEVIAAFAPIARGESLEGRRGSLLMIHGAGCTGAAFARMGRDLEVRGWRVEAPTLSPHLRVGRRPPRSLAALELADYVAEAAGWARRLERETGVAPVLVGHSMGGLIVQKLLEGGVGRAGVLITPAAPADVPAPAGAAQAFTFANILLTPDLTRTARKIWKPGLAWGVLNRVPKARRGAIYEEAVFESGRVFHQLARRSGPPAPVEVDETAIRAPMLTIGAKLDRATPEGWAQATARKYSGVSGAYRCYEDHAHWIIDEPGTDQVTGDIDAWLHAALAP